jgi:hypothetical protein
MRRVLIGLLVALLAIPAHAQSRKSSAQPSKATQQNKQRANAKHSRPAPTAPPPVYDTEKAMR